MDHFKFLTCLFLLGALAGCTHQEINNSPCATLNAPIQIKPAANLAFMFGTDGIKAALDAVSGLITPLGNKSLSNLTSSGTEAAVRTAKANGKNPTADDISALETYLRDDVVPAMKQNPTCNFTVVSSGRPYIGIEKLFLRKSGVEKFPMMVIVNTGLAEANAHVDIRQVLDGREHSKDSVDLILIPNQRKTITLKPNLPIPDIDSGKTALAIVVDIAYPLESGAVPINQREAWRYDHASNQFYSATLK